MEAQRTYQVSEDREKGHASTTVSVFDLASGSAKRGFVHPPVVGNLSCAVVRAGGAVRWARY